MGSATSNFILKDKKFQFEAKIGWRPLLKKAPFNNWLTAFENIRTDFHQ